MFKVGDKVRRINHDYSEDFRVGTVVTVTKAQIEPSGAQWLELEEYKQNWSLPYEARFFEMAHSAPETIPRFTELPLAGPFQALGINPKDMIGQKKVDLSLIPPAALIYIALAMEDGAKKYGPFNWRENKVRARVYLAAAMRHIAAKLDGEELATDSLKPHLAHAMACLAIYVDAEETGNLHDDRPTPGAAARLIEKWEKKPETKKEAT